jgi:hypothetical protein
MSTALGKRIAKEPHAIDKMFQYIRSAAAAEADDLTCPDAWENLIYDLECALAVRWPGRSVAEVRPSCSH